MEDVESNVVVPKKRGRPSKKNAVKKESTGRGRGRPPKHANGSPIPTEKPVAANGAGDDGDDVAEEKRRGRPTKPGIKSKLKKPIVATGRGRGRPKAQNGGSTSPNEKVKPKENKKIGRPRKEEDSDDASDASKDDDEDDEEERRPVGRPSTGAVNLNIESTGRGKGRPKKEVQKRANTNDSSLEEGTQKKRGRPSSNKESAPKASSGKPRGRPKPSDDEAIDEADDDVNDEEDDDEDANTSGNEANGGKISILDDSDAKDENDD